MRNLVKYVESRGKHRGFWWNGWWNFAGCLASEGMYGLERARNLWAR
jgi:hypothetical protein